MGLLDDAIREHLELKRRRGADPGEIAHQERDALDPVLSGEQEAIGGELEPTAPAAQAEAAVPEDELLAEPDAPPETARASEPEQAPSGLSHAGQETAELDMEEVLAADEGDTGAVAAPPDEPAARSDDSLEWEIPKRARQEPSPEDTPDQERLSFE